MTRHRTPAVAIAALAFLAACGGGGGGGNPGAPANGGTGGGGQPPVQPNPPPVSETHRGGGLRGDNFGSLRWNADPQADLPRDGRNGLRVIRPPHGGAIILAPDAEVQLNDRLEPLWRLDNALGREANERLEQFYGFLWILGNQAYRQWTRHLDTDPGVLRIQVGSIAGLECGGPQAAACYRPGTGDVVLNDSTLVRNYRRYIDYLITGNDVYGETAIQELFLIITHEAGHQFGYKNPAGATHGGCDPDDPCHAPVGSGSVMSYDDLPPPRGANGSVRYGVTAEDVRHIPDATWNDDESDRYTVSMSGEPSSIDGWGVWIDHYFAVSGRTDPGRLSGGGLDITDEIHGRGWVRGTPSGDALPPASATWSGADGFLGVDLNEDFLGALLRADADLRYTFGARPNMTLRVSGFEAHYDAGGGARWHDHVSGDWGDFTYRMDCARGGCSGEGAEARWYASDAGDPTGWVGGAVEDRENSYVGSFVAERD